ncbi:hypothetical protein [Nocardiopsis halotolerans]|uniref:hypothetical protein n=1 Tax=Nocardiopsis halotolerans TaxID=124252 RepID=UPI00034B09BB|nr:hypothetical protein [Nocardiopsis halotolerans]
MFDITSVSALLALVFEGVYVVIGIIVLVLTATVASGRRGLVATGGVVLGLGALCNVLLQAGLFYFTNMRMLTPDSPVELLSLLRNVSSFVFVGGLLLLVLAASKRSAERTAVTSPPPPPPAHPGPQTSSTR